MSAVNAVMNRLFAALWTPFQGLSPWVGLALLSVAVGVLALVAMKYFSNQQRIVVLKDRYKSHVLAIKLFRDDPWIVLLSLGRTLRLVSFYLGHQLRPMAVMIVPIVLVFAQMQMRLAYAPHPLEEKILVTVDLTRGQPGVDTEVRLELPDGVEAAGRAVRIPTLGQVVFPVRATADGAYDLRLTCGEETVVKTLHAGSQDGDLTMLSPSRSSGFWDLLLYPTEARFAADSAFEQISVSAYPIRELRLLGINWSFGWELGMGITFMVISIVAALLLKGLFGVTI